MNLTEALAIIAAYTPVPFGDDVRLRLVKAAQKVVHAEAEKIRLRVEAIHQARLAAEQGT